MRQSPKESAQLHMQTEPTCGLRESLFLHAADAQPGGTGAWTAMERAVPNPWVWKPGR
ncbi:hypothetical protein [Gorillibacterium sp. sgz5001074]|uniref:hypothetical protein n=1 Tax=Gorillibacterium sp. sgz5001074 TaxID=3446695 RepID=UPI003F66F406